MKSYTNIEQSKELAKILPPESADMARCGGENVIVTNYISAKKKFSVCGEITITPCWSLAALLNIIPQSITKYIESERCQKTFHLNLFRSYYYCCSYSFSPSISDDDGDNTLYCIGRDNWVDACYEMIIKLHELNLL